MAVGAITWSATCIDQGAGSFRVDLSGAFYPNDQYWSNGTRIPAGSTVQMRVVESARSEHSKDRAKLAFAPISVTIDGTTYTIDGHVTQTPKFNMERVQSTQVQGEKIAAGAAIGAIAGQIIGHDTRSTVIGATVGAAGGTAVAAGTADYDACVPNTGAIQITLDRSLSFRGG